MNTTMQTTRSIHTWIWICLLGLFLLAAQPAIAEQTFSFNITGNGVYWTQSCVDGEGCSTEGQAASALEGVLSLQQEGFLVTWVLSLSMPDDQSIEFNIDNEEGYMNVDDTGDTVRISAWKSTGCDEESGECQSGSNAEMLVEMNTMTGYVTMNNWLNDAQGNQYWSFIGSMQISQ